MDYYTLQDDEKHARGPFSAQELLQEYDAGSLPEGTLAAAAGDSFWQPLASILRVAQADYEESLRAPAVVDAEQIISDAMETGPRTAPLLLKLLREDGHPYPIPRKRLRR